MAFNLISQLSNSYLGMLGPDSLGHLVFEEDQKAEIIIELKREISQILQNPDITTEIAERSYIHDNGFAKLVLFRGIGQIAEIRLHLWGNLPELPLRGWDVNIHDHSANFSSYILYGKLEEQICEISSEQATRSDMNLMEYKCGSRADQTQYELQEIAHRILRISASCILKANQWHVMRHDILHRVRPMSESVVTLFVQTNRIKRGTRAFGEPVKSGTNLVNSPSLNCKIVQSLLGKILTLLK